MGSEMCIRDSPPAPPPIPSPPPRARTRAAATSPPAGRPLRLRAHGGPSDETRDSASIWPFHSRPPSPPTAARSEGRRRDLRRQRPFQRWRGEPPRPPPPSKRRQRALLLSVVGGRTVRALKKNLLNSLLPKHRNTEIGASARFLYISLACLTRGRPALWGCQGACRDTMCWQKQEDMRWCRHF